MAYAWQRALGHATARKPLCSLVWDRAHPDVWDANHVSEVRARTAAEVEQVLQWADDSLGHCRHRLVMVDPLTPAAVTARLALDDYRELTPTIQLVLDGSLRAEPRVIELRAVTSDEDWQKLAELVRHDHTEAGRTQTHAMPPEVTRGIVAGYRKKAPTYQFFLACVDGADCAYGAGALAPNRIGMVEDLFTLPGFRKRGIATALIARAIAHVRQVRSDARSEGAVKEPRGCHDWIAHGTPVRLRRSGPVVASHAGCGGR